MPTHKAIKRDYMLPEFGGEATPERLLAQNMTLSANIKVVPVGSSGNIYRAKVEVNGKRLSVKIRKSSSHSELDKDLKLMLFNYLITGVWPTNE